MQTGEKIDRVRVEENRGNEEIMNLFGRGISKLMIILIRFYQVCISPFFPPTCRFYPTCSTYFIQALARYGPLKGTYLGIHRILRCHPGNPGGYDPLP